MYPAKEIKVICQTKYGLSTPFKIIHLTPQYLSLLSPTGFQPVVNVEPKKIKQVLPSFLASFCPFSFSSLCFYGSEPPRKT